MNRVKFFLNDSLAPDISVINQIKTISKWEGVKSVSVFPDLSFKSKEIIPTGVVFDTDDLIYPIAIKSNFNCGITVIKTSLYYKDLDHNKISLIYKHLKDAFSDRKNSYWQISRVDLNDIIYKGVEWAKDRVGLSDSDQKNIEDEGSFFKNTDFTFKEVLNNIPSDVYQGGFKKLGSMWVGNHFLEMSRVSKVIDNDIAKTWGIEKDQIIFMIHGEPGAFGGRIGKYFMDRKDLSLKELIRKHRYHFTLNIKKYSKRRSAYFNTHSSPFAIEADSDEARRYISCAYAAANYGFVNRVLAYKLVQDIVVKYIDKNVKMEILIDVAHKIIKQEDLGGRKFWVHRNGASLALGPSFIKSHSLYSKTGQPVPLPGSMTAGSYICAAKDESSKSLFSVNHGTGRRISKKEIKEMTTNEDVYNLLREEGVHIERMGDGDISGASPEGYKPHHILLMPILPSHRNAGHRFWLYRQEAAE